MKEPQTKKALQYYKSALKSRTLERYERSKLQKKASKYIEGDFKSLLETARAATNSTGADLSDYVMLHSYIRHAKPTHVLECGSGLTTWIIADALRQNWEEAGRPADGKGLVVSVEEDEGWHKHARDGLANHEMADQLLPFIEYVHSGREYFHYSFLFGVTYENIPDYPYEFMFVDGPVCRYYHDENLKETFEHTAALDLVKLLLRRKLKLTVFIDNLKRTQMAYTCLFKPGSLVHYKSLSNIGVMEDITNDDLLIDTAEYIPIFSKVVQTSKFMKCPKWMP